MEALAALAKAPSKRFVEEVFEQAVACGGSLSGAVAAEVGAALGLDPPSQGGAVAGAAHTLASRAVFADLSPAEIAAAVPSAVDRRVAELCAAIVARHSAAWRETALAAQVALPAYAGVDWRVDVKAASDMSLRLQQPTVLLDLAVRGVPDHVGAMPPCDTHTVELSREALHTMLEGMRRLRDQLSSVK